MGVRNYLIEGVSGSGKTTAAEGLQRRGYHVIHGDRELAYVGDPRTGEPMVCPAHDSMAETAAWRQKHWVWPVERVRSLIADRHNPISFFCGGARNLDLLIDLFDGVIVLDVDRDTLNRRLAARPEDEFGGRPVERELIVRLHATNANVPKNAMRIDATGAPATVVDAILLKCSGAGQCAR